MVMFEIESVAFPVFVNVIRGQEPVVPVVTLPQLIELGVRLTAGAVPVPVRFTV